MKFTLNIIQRDNILMKKIILAQIKTSDFTVIGALARYNCGIKDI